MQSVLTRHRCLGYGRCSEILGSCTLNRAAPTLIIEVPIFYFPFTERSARCGVVIKRKAARLLTSLVSFPRQGASASTFPLYFTAGPSVRQKREAFNKVRCQNHYQSFFQWLALSPKHDAHVAPRLFTFVEVCGSPPPPAKRFYWLEKQGTFSKGSVPGVAWRYLLVNERPVRLSSLARTTKLPRPFTRI